MSLNKYFSEAKTYANYELKSGFRTFAQVVGAVFGVLLIIVLYDIFFNTNYSIASVDPMHGTMKTLLRGGIFFSAILSASLMFNNLAKKEGRIQNLMLPTSQLTKYLIRWVIFIPLSIVCYCVIFEIVDIIRLIVVNIHYDSTVPCQLFDTGTCLFTDKGFDLWGILIFFQGFFALGAIIWPKRSVAKTTIAFISIVIVNSGYGAWLSNLCLSSNMSYGWDITNDHVSAIVFISECLMALICYIIAYYRFKEIEIIQRW